MTEEKEIRLQDNEIYRILITKDEYKIAQDNASKCSFGGTSHVRSERAELTPSANGEKPFDWDQLTGQLGQLAGHKCLFGNIDDYCKGREVMNRNPRRGDSGSDVTGANIDFKTSRIQNEKKCLLYYHLLVRPPERHPGTVYIPILVWINVEEKTAVAYVLGWASEDMLPKDVETVGDFKGAYVFGCSFLKPLPPPIKWDSNKETVCLPLSLNTENRLPSITSRATVQNTCSPSVLLTRTTSASPGQR